MSVQFPSSWLRWKWVKHLDIDHYCITPGSYQFDKMLKHGFKIPCSPHIFFTLIPWIPLVSSPRTTRMNTGLCELPHSCFIHRQCFPFTYLFYWPIDIAEGGAANWFAIGGILNSWDTCKMLILWVKHWRGAINFQKSYFHLALLIITVTRKITGTTITIKIRGEKSFSLVWSLKRPWGF